MSELHNMVLEDVSKVSININTCITLHFQVRVNCQIILLNSISTKWCIIYAFIWSSIHKNRSISKENLLSCNQLENYYGEAWVSEGTDTRHVNLATLRCLQFFSHSLTGLF